MFRVIGPDGDHLALVDDVQDVVRVVRLGRRGRYVVEETGASLESPGHTTRHWGTAIKFPSGDIAIHPLPGPE